MNKKLLVIFITLALALLLPTAYACGMEKWGKYNANGFWTLQASYKEGACNSANAVSAWNGLVIKKEGQATYTFNTKALSIASNGAVRCTIKLTDMKDNGTFNDNASFYYETLSANNKVLKSGTAFFKKSVSQPYLANLINYNFHGKTPKFDVFEMCGSKYALYHVVDQDTDNDGVNAQYAAILRVQ
ncbi:MAG: hypothetical protein AABW72_03660 [archaeon]